jgi:hypothetical protein
MMAMLSFSTIGGLSAHLSSCKKIRQNIAASNNRDQQSYSTSTERDVLGIARRDEPSPAGGDSRDGRAKPAICSHRCGHISGAMAS